VDFLDKLPGNLAQLTGGSFGYGRGLAVSSTPLAMGNLVAAGEIEHNDGPWQRPDDFQKLNGMMRYARGSADDGFSLTALAYGSRWHSTDQIAQRAVEEGLIDRFGTLDPTDGGNTQRYSLSGRWAMRDGDIQTRANAYVISSQLKLFNNFTYFLRDPVNGDQFEQKDDRLVIGGGASRSFFHSLMGQQSETTFGVQTRFDDIDLGLFNTEQRDILSTV